MLPKINQNITINIRNHDKSYKSIVAEIGENELLIGFPMFRTVTGLISEGTQLEVTFLTNGNKYKFQTQIIGRKVDNMPLFRISKPKEKDIVKVQLRENFRVKANIELKVKETALTTVNLSAGGLLFSCTPDLDLHPGEELRGTIFIPNLQTNQSDAIRFEGQIKRITAVEDEERKYVATEFTHLDNRDQMKIIQYCFEKQRQMRLKERKSK